VAATTIVDMALWRAFHRATTTVVAAVLTVSILSAPWTPVAGTAPASGTDQGYGWPLSPVPSVVRRFEPPAQRWLAGHRGVDLAAPAGAVVRSAGDGIVHFAGQVAGKPVVSIRHPDGLLTTYEPVTGSVSEGMSVSRGSPIGMLDSGHAGCPSACLHWGARRGAGASAVYFDPLALLGLVRVRLKPLQPGDG
jgi:murein DD-endopeptidase MepM/ murein hydrolase activator NlpD